MAQYEFAQVHEMLDREVIDLFVEMYQAWRTADRERRLVVISGTISGTFAQIFGSKFAERVPASDIDDMMNVGLLRHRNKSSYMFAPEAGAFYAYVMSRRGAPLEAVEETTRSLVEHGSFASRYPETARLLSQAIEAALADDEPRRRTQVGHDVREALIAFTGELGSRLDVSLGAPPQNTNDRRRQLIKSREKQIGSETAVAYLDALVGYWIGVSRLAVRQEHGAKAEQETLTWEDSRRAVHAAVHLVYEIDRALG